MFRVIRTVTDSATIAIVCASLFIVAVPRTYSYPKWLIYAGAASLWWSYVWWPSTRKAMLAGAAVAVAFYWRHDHGVLVAVGVALSMIAAHGWTYDAARRTADRWFRCAPRCPSVPGLCSSRARSRQLRRPRPRPRSPASTFEHIPSFAGRCERLPTMSGSNRPEWYAPEIIIRWKPNLAPDARAAALEKYGLTPTANEGGP